MSEKTKVMSLSLEPELQEFLTVSAKKMGWSRSELIRRLTKHIDLVVNDGEEIPVIIKIPINLKGNEAELLQWLSVKSSAIAKALK
jgi:metal-responsive CopG/Arc/MetJ family transcriptional regulator